MCCHHCLIDSKPSARLSTLIYQIMHCRHLLVLVLKYCATKSLKAFHFSLQKNLVFNLLIIFKIMNDND